MQTFLPYPDFEKSAKVLDYRRLGKQRVEAQQLLDAMQHHGGWFKHPARVMWSGFELALWHYRNVMIREWMNRGYRNTMLLIDLNLSLLEYPPWFGNEAFHASHRSNLLRKDPLHYGEFGWKEPHDLPYIWPNPKNASYVKG